MEKLNLLAALPEIVLLIATCVVLLADVIRGRGAPVDGVDRLAYLALRSVRVREGMERAVARGLLDPDPATIRATPLGLRFLNDLQQLFLT